MTTGRYFAGYGKIADGMQTVPPFAVYKSGNMVAAGPQKAGYRQKTYPYTTLGAWLQSNIDIWQESGTNYEQEAPCLPQNELTIYLTLPGSGFSGIRQKILS
jgi:hypothetical protein